MADASAKRPRADGPAAAPSNTAAAIAARIKIPKIEADEPEKTSFKRIAKARKPVGDGTSGPSAAPAPAAGSTTSASTDPAASKPSVSSTQQDSAESSAFRRDEVRKAIPKRKLDHTPNSSDFSIAKYTRTEDAAPAQTQRGNNNSQQSNRKQGGGRGVGYRDGEIGDDEPTFRGAGASALDSSEQFPELTLSAYERTLSWTKRYANPHCAQRHFGSEKNEEFNIPFSRILRPDAKAIPYRRRRNERKSALHWGQRKLLMAEIEFLTSYSQPNDLVVYAGAAPGTHIGLLADMFPFVRFLLVDPADFVCRPSARLDIHNGFFTDEMATQLAGRSDVLFISDIRSADWNHQSQAEVEAGVKQDMQNQMRWHLLMKPRVSLLKFRLPWEPGTCDYLDGTVYLPVWGPQTTTETRMVVSGSAMKRWDNVRYEQQMFYFNTVARVALYPHQVRADGIDHCFDCSSEVEILRQYVERMHPRWVFEMGQTDPAGLEADPVDFIILNAEYRQEDEDARASMPPPEAMQAAPISADTSAGDGAPAAAADAMNSTSAAAGGDSNGSTDVTAAAPPAAAAPMDTSTSATESTAAPASAADIVSAAPPAAAAAVTPAPAVVPEPADLKKTESKTESTTALADSEDPTFDLNATRQPFPTPYSDSVDMQRALPHVLRCVERLSEIVSSACSTGRRSLSTVLPTPDKRKPFPRRG